MASHIPRQAVALLNEQTTYEVVALPFRLQVVSSTDLEKSHVQHTLSILEDGGVKDQSIAEGGTVLIGEETYTVQAIQPWSGLWRDARGAPMVNVAWRVAESSWMDEIFVRDGESVPLRPAGAVDFTWVDSEATARASLKAKAQNATRSSWSVTASDGVTTSQGVQLGTGVELGDGTEFTLIRREEVHGTSGLPAILVEVERSGVKEEVWIPANGESPDGLIRFDHHDGLALSLYAWSDDRVLAAAVHGSGAFEDRMLTPGETWSIEPNQGGPYTIRLDEAMAQAFPVRESDTTLYEMVLEGNGQVIPLRHGASVPHDGRFLTYRRAVDVAPVNLRLLAHHYRMEQVTTVLLSPDRVINILHWRIKQLATPGGIDAFLLEATYDPGVSYTFWLGAARCVAAALLMLFRAALWLKSLT
jgi:hypothetical protein